MQILNLNQKAVLADRVAVAATSAQRRRGLLGRKEMPAGEALWISPCEAIHTFRMKMAIDVVFLGRDWEVLKTVRALRPWRIALCLRATSVLELPAGTVERTRTECGHRLELIQAPVRWNTPDRSAAHRRAFDAADLCALALATAAACDGGNPRLSAGDRTAVAPPDVLR